MTRGESSCPVAIGEVIGNRYTAVRPLRETPTAWFIAAAERSDSAPHVTLKLFRPERATSAASLRDTANQEIAVLLRAQNHPGATHLARPADRTAGEHRGIPFLSLAHLEAPSLASELSRRAPLPDTTLQRIGAGIAAGLSAIHLAGGLHGALTPDGILLRGPADPVLQSLALEATLHDHQAAPAPSTAAFPAPSTAAFPVAVPAPLDNGEPLLDHRYAAPEQLSRQRPLPASDVYALGLILHEMLTGHLLLAGRTWQETLAIRAHLPPLPPRVAGRALQGPFAALTLQCLHPEPQRRPAAADVARALSALPRSRSRFVIPGVVAGVVAGVVLAATTAASWPGRQHPPEPPRDIASSRISPAPGAIEMGKAASTAPKIPPQPRPRVITSDTIAFPNPPARVTTVDRVKHFASGRVGAALDLDGRLLSWDADAGFRMRSGQAPYQVPLDGAPVQLVSGINFPLLLDDRGVLTTWTRQGEPPTLVPSISNVIAVAAGINHVVALHRGGTVSLLDRQHQLDATPGPVMVDALSNVTAVAAGAHGMSVALLHDGSLWSWRHRTSKLSYGPTLEVIPPRTEIYGMHKLDPLADVTAIALRDNRILALDRSGAVHETRRQGHWSKIDRLPPITSLCAFSDAAAALDAEGRVWTWGEFGYGQDHRLELPNPARVEGLPPVVALSVSHRQSLALDAHGALWVWGTLTECDRPPGPLGSLCK